MQFNSNDITTRVTENASDGSYSWVKGDMIGISMKWTYGDYSYNIYENVCYSAASTASSTSFDVAGSESISIDANVDDDFEFVAYYPYSDDGNFDIDVSDQSDLSEWTYFVATTSQHLSYLEGVDIDPINFEF